MARIIEIDFLSRQTSLATMVFSWNENINVVVVVVERVVRVFVYFNTRTRRTRSVRHTNVLLFTPVTAHVTVVVNVLVLVVQYQLCR